MTTIDDTNQLILSLASDPRREGPALRPTLTAAALSGLVIALVASLAFIASRNDLADGLVRHWLYQKLFCMIAVAWGAWLMLVETALPGRRSNRYGMLVFAIVLLAAGALFEPDGTGFLGHSISSAPACTSAIVLLSLPGLFLIMAALRRAAAPTRPALAGLFAGLLSGAVGGIAYAFACRNDGGAFIALWYGSALVIAGGLGATAGRVALTW